MKSEMTKKSLIATVVITLLVGVVFIIFPEQVMNLLNYIVAGLLIVLGLVSVILHFKASSAETYSLKFTLGIVFIIFGLYLILNEGFILQILTVFFGFYILINGILGLQVSIDSLRMKTDKWKISIGIALINTILGAVILYNPFAGTQTLIMYIGIFMVVTAVLNGVGLIFINKVKS